MFSVFSFGKGIYHRFSGTILTAWERASKATIGLVNEDEKRNLVEAPFTDEAGARRRECAHPERGEDNEKLFKRLCKHSKKGMSIPFWGERWQA